jgi:hypothetical protein
MKIHKGIRVLIKVVSTPILGFLTVVAIAGGMVAFSVWVCFGVIAAFAYPFKSNASIAGEEWAIYVPYLAWSIYIALTLTVYYFWAKEMKESDL